jgi:hypothetical protein
MRNQQTLCATNSRFFHPGNFAMKKLLEVEEARSIMSQGMDWGVWKWLMEKKRVRIIADRATDALNAAEMKVKEAWPEELKLAYDALVDEDFANEKKKKKNGAFSGIDPEMLATARAVKEADEIAEQCRLKAEDIFDDADRKMSTELARQGARKALERYDLHEKAIRKAEAALKGK